MDSNPTANVESQTFHWRGMTEDGRSCSGTRAASDKGELMHSLALEGIVLTGSRRHRPRHAAGRITTAQLEGFTRQMATLVTAGLPLASALQLMAQTLPEGRLATAAADIRRELHQGRTLHEALSRQGSLFPVLYCRLVHVGEATGTLDTLLVHLADHLQHQCLLAARMRKALAYPLFLSCLTAVVAAAMLIWVVPQFEAIYQGFGARLPLLTQVLMDLSDTLRNEWKEMLMALLILLPALRHLPSSVTGPLHRFLEQVSLQLPVIGTVRQMAATGRIARTLAITTAAGLPLIDALELTAGAAGTRRHHQAVSQLRQQVLSGIALHRALQADPLFPSLLHQMTAIGEESGTLDNMLTRVADHYQTQLSRHLDLLSSLAEPAMMLVVGIVVGLIVVGMYLPVFQLTSVM